MTQIVGTLKDSGGNPLSGKLIVTLTGTMIETSTTPDSIHLVEPREFTITNGVVDIELQESETKKITYTFQFYKLDAESELIEPPLLRFNAIVPNVASVEFASLVPTGIVNDALDTGAIRVANVIANNPNLAQNIGGVFPKGAYDPDTEYKRGDIVTYLSRSYIAKNIVATADVLPTDELFWQLFPIEPTGDLLLGDDTPYGASWDGSGLAASQGAVYDEVEAVKSNVNLKANIDSPIFTGTPSVPTQATADNSTRAATTAFVKNVLANSPALEGNPTAPTQTATNNSTRIATTAFVKANITDGTWQNVIFQDGWGNFGSPWGNVQYRKKADGVVVVRGLTANATYAPNTTIFTLPAGFRPQSGFIRICEAGANSAPFLGSRIDILSNGEVNFVNFNFNTATLINISYVSLEFSFETT